LKFQTAVSVLFSSPARPVYGTESLPASLGTSSKTCGTHAKDNGFVLHGQTKIQLTLFNPQNVMDKRLADLQFFDYDKFENDKVIFSLALVFELQLRAEFLHFFKYI
jgi:hypothetical protein